MAITLGSSANIASSSAKLVSVRVVDPSGSVKNKTADGVQITIECGVICGSG